MKFILKMILSAVAVLVLAEILPGVGVDSYVSALIVAFVLAILNAVVKPILVILTLPVTVVTLGLFLLVINAAIILLADYFISGFSVSGWLWALIFSVLLSVFQSILYSILKKDKK
ncbi:phage holin family protein [Aquimarina sp. 2201CG5-10]|uniref:phage holin family protein n=1 Tax=Aquimarina callyspongiae TaxID=3098150 RepID=UPI002AB46878|nr:phage holin family protein [Aquimarina sp. 2201CG5-10]MDY8136660.1 phage holin family protein [Aquimarina sp. 2201CG5-10]